MFQGADHDVFRFDRKKSGLFWKRASAFAGLGRFHWQREFLRFDHDLSRLPAAPVRHDRILPFMFSRRLGKLHPRVDLHLINDRRLHGCEAAEQSDGESSLCVVHRFEFPDSVVQYSKSPPAVAHVHKTVHGILGIGFPVVEAGLCPFHRPLCHIERRFRGRDPHCEACGKAYPQAVLFGSIGHSRPDMQPPLILSQCEHAGDRQYPLFACSSVCAGFSFKAMRNLHAVFDPVPGDEAVRFFESDPGSFFE